jgi:hypothetical protein
MDVIAITFVTASTALISAVTRPLVSYIVARRQIRASVISNNRERWIEALRDSVAEYVALLLSAYAVKRAMGQDPLKAMSENHTLLQIVDSLVLLKSKIMLMAKPSEGRYHKLCEAIELTYQCLALDDPEALSKIHTGAEAITRT